MAELFLLSNVAFLTVNVYVAHSVNGFAAPAEWAPVAFSTCASLLLVLAMLIGGSVQPPLPPRSEHPRRAAGTRRRIAWLIGLAVGSLSIVVGLAGLILHLESSFFREMTVHNLVYAAPFAAPLAYAGLGFLAILNRMVPSESDEWAGWVIFLALGGFAGNFVLSLTDHAQNGFFDGREWIAVSAAAFAVGGLLAALFDYRNRPYLWLCLLLMATQIAVGLLGWYYHLTAIYHSPMPGLWDRILYGAGVRAAFVCRSGLAGHVGAGRPAAIAGTRA